MSRSAQAWRGVGRAADDPRETFAELVLAPAAANDNAALVRRPIDRAAAWRRAAHFISSLIAVGLFVVATIAMIGGF